MNASPLPVLPGVLGLDAGQAIGADAFRRLPYVARVMAENLLRHLGRPGIDLELLRSLAAPRAARSALSYPLHVSRLILPDSSGIPVLMDLAALQSEVDRRGGDARRVRPQVPIDLIVDHSLQVDVAGSPQAEAHNLQKELQRNRERYEFLKWAQSAFEGLRVFPPGTGIIHQINLELLASVVASTPHGDGVLAHPEFVLGGDSHTPMINALGVLGWGVGGIEAESAALGEPYIVPPPYFVGVELRGALPAHCTITDLALYVTQRLREQDLVGAFVEFHGEAVAGLSVPDRATLANMAPEYGATTGFWPVDETTLGYLAMTGRPPEQLRLVEAYARAAGLFRSLREPAAAPVYDHDILLDLGEATPAVAGPGKPHFRRALGEVPASFQERLASLPAQAGAASSAPPAAAGGDGAGAALRDGLIALAAITSCTNTSNPRGMLTAGLLARKAVERGLKAAGHVKTSLAPGARSVTRYLDRSGLLAPLEALGFHVIGYGCTTCGGKSGPLHADVARAVETQGVKAVAVLSGNRNFDGRIHRQVSASYLCSPALVVAYAIAGHIGVDLERDPLGADSAGLPVYLRDLWPSAQELAQAESQVQDPGLYDAREAMSPVAVAQWARIPARTGRLFPWQAASNYIVEPPFFSMSTGGLAADADAIAGARVLTMFDDSLTTDHISPSGEIPVDSSAGRYLLSQGVAQEDFNTYVGRRGNHHVMVRGTYANVRLRNRLVPEREGGWTLSADGDCVPLFEAVQDYERRGTPLLVLAGWQFGMGSSRDWAAKGQALQGIRAIIARSFERIHRSNLIGVGIWPLLFLEGQSIESLGLTGLETYDIQGLRAALEQGEPLIVTARAGDRRREFAVTLDVRSDAEAALLAAGGMFPRALARYV